MLKLKAAPSTSHFVETPNLPLHYLDYGTAGRRPMLCVHGSAAHAHWFDFIASDFASDHHVLAIDQRGHGESMWPEKPLYTYQRLAADLGDLVEKLDLRDFLLVGHSMGGTVCLVYAATHPGRVGELVIVDSTLQMTEEEAARLRTLASRPGSSYGSREEFLSHFRLRPQVASPDTVRHIAGHSARQFPNGLWSYNFDHNVYLGREIKDGMHHWTDIQVPVLILKGDQSKRITSQAYGEVAARCPQAELVEVANSGHHITLDNPSGFVEATRSFLSRQSRV